MSGTETFQTRPRPRLWRIVQPSGPAFSLSNTTTAFTRVIQPVDVDDELEIKFTARLGQSVPLDSAQQFEATAHDYFAEFGRASGGIVIAAPARQNNDETRERAIEQKSAPSCAEINESVQPRDRVASCNQIDISAAVFTPATRGLRGCCSLSRRNARSAVN